MICPASEPTQTARHSESSLGEARQVEEGASASEGDMFLWRGDREVTLDHGDFL